MAEHPYVIEQIDETGWRIEDNFVRAFLFEGRGRALLIDTGLGSGDIKTECARLTSKPITLVHTHADQDHTGGDNSFDEILLHPSEYPWFFEQIPQSRDTAALDAKIKPVWEGDVFDLGGRSFEVILTPGHTPGSIALLDRGNRILIPGDTISEEPVFLFGKTRSLNAYIESLKKLLSMRDAFDICYPSHGAIPVSPEIIGTLLAGALRLKARELQGCDPGNDVPALLYKYSGISFYYTE